MQDGEVEGVRQQWEREWGRGKDSHLPTHKLELGELKQPASYQMENIDRSLGSHCYRILIVGDRLTVIHAQFNNISILSQSYLKTLVLVL